MMRGAMAAAASLLAACGGDGGGLTAPTSVSLAIKLSDYASLANVGGVALVSASNSPIAVVRTGTSSFVALSRVCPHQGGLINTSSTGFICSKHSARFNSSGTWTGGERTSSMRSYPASYDSSTGMITIG
jgi:Rieske Fe-S protein